MREILEAVRQARHAGTSCVFCSVVETRGSTPQKAGAIMVVFPNGHQIGTLGGGCVEAEVRQNALRMASDTKPSILSFTLDDDYGWDDGLICGGRMTFCAQPLNPRLIGNYFETFADLVEQGNGCTEAVCIDEKRSGIPQGSRFLFDSQGSVVASLWSKECPESVTKNIVTLDERPKPRCVDGIAYLPVLPRCRLVIVGAGHVGQKVAELAQQVDFDIWVLDDRESYANKGRFPQAEKVVVGDIGRTLKDFECDLNTYCLIVTRGHSHDEEALYHLAEKPARYVGMIGSKRKIRMIFDDLLKEGISADALSRVHAPLGIDIGSQTVPEIAISIVAQLVGHRNRGSEAFPPSSTIALPEINECAESSD